MLFSRPPPQFWESSCHPSRLHHGLFIPCWLGLAWHQAKSKPVSLQPAQLKVRCSSSSGERGSNQPFSASLLFGRGLPSLTQLPVYNLAHHAGSLTCRAAWCTWDGSQVVLLAMGLSLVLLPSGRYKYGVQVVLIKCVFSYSQQTPFPSIRSIS